MTHQCGSRTLRTVEYAGDDAVRSDGVRGGGVPAGRRTPGGGASTIGASRRVMSNSTRRGCGTRTTTGASGMPLASHGDGGTSAGSA